MEQNKAPIPLTDRQQKLLVELVRTNDIKAASKAAGIGRTTAYRWMQQAEFSNELKNQRNRTMNEALNAIKSLTIRATETMTALLDSENDSIRRMVCRDILRQAIKVREMEEIERRIDQLEKTMQNINGR